MYLHVPDPMSQSQLASATAPHATSKHKTIELYNPSHVVEFKSTGTLTFKWSFSWEESVSGSAFVRFCLTCPHLFGNQILLSLSHKQNQSSPPFKFCITISIGSSFRVRPFSDVVRTAVFWMK